MNSFRTLFVVTSLLASAACLHSSGQSKVSASEAGASFAPGQIYSVQNTTVSPTGQTILAEGTPQEQAPTAGYSTALPTESPLEAGSTKRLTYNSVTTSQPVVAMTFDDGPHATLTPKLLDMLKQRKIHATFYLLGQNAKEYPDIVKRIIAEGHEVGNHSYDHKALNTLSAPGVASQIDRTNEVIQAAAGVLPPTMRPPYGATNASLNRRLNEEFHLPVIMWSVDPQDWKYRNASRVSSHIIANAKPGDIILAHDIHPSTIEAMPEALDALLAKGLKFATVSELLKLDEGPRAVLPVKPANQEMGDSEPAKPSKPSKKKKKGKSQVTVSAIPSHANI